MESTLDMDGGQLIVAERRRQLQAEGWTQAHDDQHDRGELARAAACYAWPDLRETLWPWEPGWYKPGSGVEGRIRDLEKAGALIAAEIDRLRRVTAALEETL